MTSAWLRLLNLLFFKLVRLKMILEFLFPAIERETAFLAPGHVSTREGIHAVRSADVSVNIADI